MAFVVGGRSYKTIKEAEDAYAEQEAALQAKAAELAAREAALAPKHRGPWASSVTYRGQFQVKFNDSDGDLGNFPAMSLCGKQFEYLLAHFDELKADYEAAKATGKIVDRWQDLPPADKTRGGWGRRKTE